MYIVLGVFYLCILSKWFEFDIIEFKFSNLSNKENTSDNIFSVKNLMDEILISIPLSIGLAIVWMRVKYKGFIEGTFKMGSIASSGRVGIWTQIFADESTPEFDYVRINDTNKGLTYQGFVYKYSQSEFPREILLQNVTVTSLLLDEKKTVINKDAEEDPKIIEYSLPYLYLSFSAENAEENVWMEFPPMSDK